MIDTNKELPDFALRILVDTLSVTENVKRQIFYGLEPTFISLDTIRSLF